MAPEKEYNLSSLDIYLSKQHKTFNDLKSLRLHPLCSMDIFADYSDKIKEEARRNTELESLKAFAEKYHWSTSLNFMLNQDYEALVLTKRDQTILWTNKGFSTMTGYPANFAKGKKPNFLQGKNTSAAIRKKIKSKVTLENNFSEILANYRKNGEEYLCKIDIYPIKNLDQQVTHFLALEKEVYEY
ncbi:PAS domain-containing protein [Zunongwangia atlantica]|uniref:Thioesterase superfamily protein n=1 Tax=Zunongwangia atlantica 22II14-10F7 TaxID=1185767 RepID=A0A1Y1T6V9_9FLAO|nr:PAS domain-containing protein [Zunongwangia atlantica]ORL46780.1 thioesterase superfamily protein [Zunongwangia atlantica 22II14-10F7]